jgi:hypothetical protein
MDMDRENECVDQSALLHFVSSSCPVDTWEAIRKPQRPTILFLKFPRSWETALFPPFRNFGFLFVIIHQNFFYL